MDEKEKAAAAEVMRRMLQTPPKPFTPKTEAVRGKRKSGKKRANTK
jgi:hypothetical protein